MKDKSSSTGDKKQFVSYNNNNLAEETREPSARGGDSIRTSDNQIEVLIALNHTVFNEREAAFYCRCSVDSIRYHALRSRKLTFCDFTREGLVFLKPDLDSFLQLSRKQGYRG